MRSHCAHMPLAACTSPKPQPPHDLHLVNRGVPTCIREALCRKLHFGFVQPTGGFESYLHSGAYSGGAGWPLPPPAAAVLTGRLALAGATGRGAPLGAAALAGAPAGATRGAGSGVEGALAALLNTSSRFLRVSEGARDKMSPFENSLRHRGQGTLPLSVAGTRIKHSLQ
jgi:hypothetical protein